MYVGRCAGLLKFQPPFVRLPQIRLTVLAKLAFELHTELQHKPTVNKLPGLDLDPGEIVIGQYR